MEWHKHLNTDCRDFLHFFREQFACLPRRVGTHPLESVINTVPLLFSRKLKVLKQVKWDMTLEA